MKNTVKAERAVESCLRPLPLQPTAPIGREFELATIRQLLLRPNVHLLTLVGVAGTGKTRLALAAAEAMEDSFPDGVCFVDLTPTFDPDEVPSLIAQEIGLQVGIGSALERVENFLRDRRMLLVLDNFEHVLPAAIGVSELLKTGAPVKILATSREPLRLRWEQRFMVNPLEVPDRGAEQSVEDVRTVASVALFLERARAVNVRFTASDDEVRQVANICARLEGLPLAIELAAARTNVFSPAEIYHRLEEQYSLLRNRRLDVPERHLSLDSALAWSYDLLTESERALFRRLGIFVGGFTLEAVEALPAGGGGSLAVLDDLSSLVDKGLVVLSLVAGGEARYHLLEVVRKFALDHLQAEGEADEIKAAHAQYYVTLSEREKQGLRYSTFLVFRPERESRELPGDVQPWPVVLDQEYANVRAALHWAKQNDTVALLRMSADLSRYWWVRGLLSEGQHWLEMGLARGERAEAHLRCRALGGLGPIYRQQRQLERALTVMEQAIDLCRTIIDPTLLMAQLIDLASVLGPMGRTTERDALVEEALRIARDLGDDWGIAAAQAAHGLGAVQDGDGRRAEHHLMESLSRFERSGDLRSVVVITACLARSIWQQQDTRRALPSIKEALRMCGDIGQETLVPLVLEMTACVLSREGPVQPVAGLLGAADGLRERGYARVTLERDTYEDAVTILTERLGGEALQTAMAAGRTLSDGSAVDQAMALVERALTSQQITPESRSAEEPLSAREREVLVLLAGGATNKAIGEQLGITENTVKFHITSMLKTLGARNRVEAVREGTRRGLV